MFRDLDYRQTVLIAAPAPNGGHVGVILNRPTRRSLGSLFPGARALQEGDRSGVLRRPVLARRAGGAGAHRRHAGHRLGAGDEEPLPRLPRQHHRPGDRARAERGALLRRLRRLAPRRVEERDRQGPVVGDQRRPGRGVPQGHRRPLGGTAAAVPAHPRRSSRHLRRRLSPATSRTRSSRRGSRRGSCPSGAKRPSRIALASGFSISDWIARFSGRAPYTGSKPPWRAPPPRHPRCRSRSPSSPGAP